MSGLCTRSPRVYDEFRARGFDHFLPRFPFSFPFVFLEKFLLRYHTLYLVRVYFQGLSEHAPHAAHRNSRSSSICNLMFDEFVFSRIDAKNPGVFLSRAPVFLLLLFALILHSVGFLCPCTGRAGGGGDVFRFTWQTFHVKRALGAEGLE